MHDSETYKLAALLTISTKICQKNKWLRIACIYIDIYSRNLITNGLVKV
jgi:hypothetical protein